MKHSLYLAAVTCAFLAASATRGAAEDYMEVFAKAGPRYQEAAGSEEGNSLWTSVTGRFGNSAFAGVRSFSVPRQGSIAFSTTVSLEADAGPRYWEKSFSGMGANVAKSGGSATRDQVVTFANDTAYQMNVWLDDPMRLTRPGHFVVSISKDPGGAGEAPVYYRSQRVDGIFTETGTLPAGTYRVSAYVRAETAEVGPTYFKKGAVKTVEGIADTSALVGFLEALTPGFLEWSDKIADFKSSTYEVRARAEKARGLLASHAAALRLTREGKPSGFGRDFRVIARAGERNSHEILPVDAARIARFTDALATSIRDYKRYKKAHDEFTLLGSEAVKDGHLPKNTLFHLDTRVPSLSSSFDKHLAGLSFFKKDRHYSAAEVKEVKERYDKAVAFFGEKLPSLRKRGTRLEGAYDFLTLAIVTGANACQNGVRGDPRLKSREEEVLNGQLGFANTYWSSLD